MNDRPDISESPCPQETRRLIKACVEEAKQNLGIPDTADAYDIVSRTNAKVRELQKGDADPPESPFDQDPVHFGSLWGEQLVQSLDWEWVKLTFHAHNDFSAFAVVSPDRSQMICPFHFVFGCLVNDAPVKIELSYNFLIFQGRPEAESRTIGPPPEPGDYKNVMDHVHFIIPPD